MEMSSKGLQCLGLTYKDELGEFSDFYIERHPTNKKLLDPSSYSSIETGLIFIGDVSIKDPPRDEVHKAIEDCREAGIKVMVLTGDNKSTAEFQEIRLVSESSTLKVKVSPVKNSSSNFTASPFTVNDGNDSITICAGYY